MLDIYLIASVLSFIQFNNYIDYKFSLSQEVEFHRGEFYIYTLNNFVYSLFLILMLFYILIFIQYFKPTVAKFSDAQVNKVFEGDVFKGFMEAHPFFSKIMKNYKFISYILISLTCITIINCVIIFALILASKNKPITNKNLAKKEAKIFFIISSFFSTMVFLYLN